MLNQLKTRDQPKRYRRSGAPSLQRVIEAYGLECHWCQRPCDPELSCNADLFPTRDHVVRLADGGSNKMDNIVIACRKCNGSRHHEGWTPPRITDRGYVPPANTKKANAPKPNWIKLEKEGEMEAVRECVEDAQRLFLSV